MCKQKFLFIFTLLVLFIVITSQACNSTRSTLEECGPSQFQCASGDCIKRQFRCDQYVDCLDGSDEFGCHVHKELLINGNPTASQQVNPTSNDTTQIFTSTPPPLSTITKKPRKRNIPNKSSNETIDVYEETLNFLEEGENQIELRPDYRDLVLVVGLTGAGKTTITKFIADPIDLEAYDNGERILIRDTVNDSISTDSTIVSKTIFPQLLIHGPTNTAFYDLPGFQNTRNATIEIANAFFMKKVAEHAARVKILLIVSHTSLRSAGTRIEFKTLIENMIKFINDIEKFSESIVLLASKVEEPRKRNDQVILGIGEFLRRVDKDLPQIFQDPEKLQHAKSFVEALLEQDEETGEYTRIGMFRQPKIKGPLTDDRDFETNQIIVQNLVFRRAQFVPTSPGDFGFSISPDSTLFAKTLATKAKKKVDLLLEKLTKVIEEELFEYPGNSSNSSGSSPWPSLRRWTRDFTIFHQMVNALDDAETCSTFFHVLNDTLSVFSIPSADDLILDLFKSNEQIIFFDKISLESDAPPKKWTNSFDKLQTKVGNKIRNMAEELNNHVTNITSAISEALKQQTINLMSTATSNGTTGNSTIINLAGSNESVSQQFNKQTLFENLNEDLNSVNGMLSQILSTSTFAQFSNVTLNVLKNTHLQVPPSSLTSLKNIEFDMNFNSGIKGQRFPFNPHIWIKPIEVFAAFLQSQIQILDLHFSEETRRQNEARMNQQLETLREETKRAAEKAEEEAQRLAEEYRQREDSMNGSMTILADDLTKVRQEQKEEREEVQTQLQKREELFNANITRLSGERVKDQQELKDRLQARERALNETFTDLSEDYEKKRTELETQMERRQESFNRNLTAAREEHQRELQKLEFSLQEREQTSLGDLRKTHDKERQKFEEKLAQDQESFNRRLTAVLEEQEKERAAHETELKEFQTQMEQEQESFNKNLTEIRKTHENELKKFLTQMEEEQESFNRNLTKNAKQHEADQQLLQTQLSQKGQLLSGLNSTLTALRARMQQLERDCAARERQALLERERQEAIRRRLEEEARRKRMEDLEAGIFPKSERFDYNNIVSVEKRVYESGTWDDTEYCPRDSIVTGYAVKYVPYIGWWATTFVTGSPPEFYARIGISKAEENAKKKKLDDYGVVGIKLFCTDVFNQELQAEITSNYLSDGEMTCRNGKSVNSVWAGSSSNSYFNCPDHHPAIGFQIRNEPHDTSWYSDNFGAINFRIICSGPTRKLSVPDIPYPTSHVKSPSWSEDVVCPQFAAVCGIQTQIDRAEDGSGLTNVKLKCCKLSGI